MVTETKDRQEIILLFQYTIIYCMFPNGEGCKDDRRG